MNSNNSEITDMEDEKNSYTLKDVLGIYSHCPQPLCNYTLQCNDLKQVCKLGSGGYASVYEVEHIPTGTFYACKKFLLSPDQKHVYSAECLKRRRVDKKIKTQSIDVLVNEIVLHKKLKDYKGISGLISQ